MRLIVLDTNIIVSARMNPKGAPAQIVLEWVLANRVQAVVCPRIIVEYIEVTQRPKFDRFGFPPEWLPSLIEDSLHLTDPLPDPTDEPFLALAYVANAWLVTGNLKHFPKSSRRGVTVISPVDYLHHLTHPE